jgi:hypothetical protein
MSQLRPNNTLVPTRKGEAPLLAAQRGRSASKHIGDTLMKTLIVLIASVAVLALAHSATAEGTDARPAGVAEKNWISISDRLGFIVVAQEHVPTLSGSRQILIAPADNVSAELMPPTKGYFVVRTETGWRRLVVSEPSELGG